MEAGTGNAAYSIKYKRKIWKREKNKTKILNNLQVTFKDWTV
jgi:hypothetical protein